MEELKKDYFGKVEAILYDYQVMKLNMEAFMPSMGIDYAHVGGGSGRSSPTEICAVKRADYSLIINTIDQVMKILTDEERQFVILRYFEKAQYKRIVSIMSSSEAHLYRIRKRVVRQFAVAFGWK